MSKAEKIVKRFIAGATCPKCGLIDKTVVYTIAGKQFSECVRCGFKQEAVDKKAKEKMAKKIIWINKDSNES